MRLPEWGRIIHSSVPVYRFRAVCVLGTAKRLAALTPWCDTRVVDRYRADQRRLCAEQMRRASVLEVGCGAGEFRRDAITEFGASLYTGLDLSHGLIKHAAGAHPRSAYVVANATSLPLRPASFDVVFTRFTFHHIPPRLRLQALQELWNVARKAVIIEDVYGMRRGMLRLLHQIYYRLADGSHYRYTLNEWLDFVRQVQPRAVQNTDCGERQIAYRTGIWVLLK
jgi:ubiquinone/menaquinone biosynthesis C-methylase UbiE